VDTKIANCIVRVGVENVERLIDEAIPKATPEFSARRIFFASYTVLRDQLIPAK
jgi:spore cortex formation protein SpoVR/YcgB (stage V sporulation)